MNTGSVALTAALRASNYPAPAVAATPGQCTLSWGSGLGSPELRVTDSGQVTVNAWHAPDAVFTLSAERQSADDWVALLHPLIAQPIADATRTAPVPAPAQVVDRSAVIVWLDHNKATGATYAVYTDNARIWISNTAADDSAASLFDTVRGRQLGINPAELMSMQSAREGTVMVNPDLAYSKMVYRIGSWEPAISFRDTRGFIERATRLFSPATPSPTVRDRSFRDFDAPTIELVCPGRSNITCIADIASVASALLTNAKRRHRAEGHHPAGL